MKDTQHGRVKRVLPGGFARVESQEHGTTDFVGALEGEEIQFKTSGRGAKRRTRIDAILCPSAHRVTPECDWADRCGGCPLMISSAAEQERMKTEWVVRALDSPQLGVAFHSSPQWLGYRRRARFHIENKRFGYRAGRSRRVVPVGHCVVLDPRLDSLFPWMRADVIPTIPGKATVGIALGVNQAPVVEIECENPASPALYQSLAAGVASRTLAGASLRSFGIKTVASFGLSLPVMMDLEGQSMIVPAFGFSQANDAMNQKLTHRVVELAEVEGLRVLELFSGNGNLTVELARRAKPVTAVESNRSAADACKANLGARGLSARVIVGNASEHVGRGPIDVVVLDPPRMGASDCLAAIAARGPVRIVYVSCDSRSLRRDVRQLRDLGYVPDTAEVFDMFPQTGHVEALVRFALASR